MRSTSLEPPRTSRVPQQIAPRLPPVPRVHPVAKTKGHKRAQRGRSVAVRPVKWGLPRTTAVKIKNRYGQVNAHFHAQSRTCPASLPSWPCRFDPGHPFHRKTLTQQGFPRAHGRPVLLKRRSCVPSAAVCTTLVPRRRDRDHPGKLAMPVRSRAPAPPKTRAQQGFHATTASACFRNVDHVSRAGPYAPHRYGRDQPGKLAMPVGATS